MRDDEKTNQQLIDELEELRRRVAAIEGIEAERSRAAEDLRRSEAKWRSVAENAPLFVAVVDQSGKMQFLNRYQPGFTSETVLGKDFCDFIQPECHAAARECLKHVFQSGEAASYESVGAGAEGTLAEYVTDVGPVIVDGEIIAATLISRDMTDRKRAEEALRQSEERFRLLVEQAVDGIFVSTAQGRYLDVNMAGCEMLGYSREEILARTIADVVAAEEVPRIVTEVARFAGGMVTRSEWRFRRKDGSFFIGEVVGRQLSDGRLQAILRDVTDRKRAEEALKKAHDGLEQRVEERTAELSRANEQLKREVEQRQRIEEDLRRSKSWLEEAQQIAKIGNWEWNVKTNEVLWSDEMYRIFGVSKATFRLNFEEHLKLIPAEDHNEYLAGLDRVIAGKDQWNREHRILLPDGNVRYVWAIGTSRRDAEGNVISLCGTTQDIMERKQAEEALQQSERQFRNYFEQGLIGMAVTSLDKRWLLVNDRLCEILGYSREELRQTTWPDLTHPDDIEPNLQLFNPLLTGEIDHFTLNKRYLKKDGSIVHTTIHTRAFRKDDGTIDHIVTLIEDITARKQAEEALSKSENRFRAFVTASSDVVYNMSPDWSEMRRLRGREFIPDTNSPSRTWLEKYIHPDDQPHVLAVINEAIRTKSNFELEHRVLRVDGTLGWTFSRAVPLLDANGEIVEWFGAASDITARKQAEAAVRISEEKYRGVVEANPDAIVMSDLNGRVLFASRQAWGLLALTDSEELVGRSVFDYVIENDRKRLAENMSNLVGVGIRRNTEYTAVRQDGTTVPAEASSTLIRDAEGRPKAVMAVIRDITERKQAEEALRASEERFRSYFEQGLIGMAVSLPDQRWIQVNDRYCDMLGYSREELLGMKWTDLTHPDDLERNLIPLNRALAGEIEHHTLEKRFIRKDGSIMYAAVFARCFRRQDGSVDHLLSLVEDITERKLAQEALERERQSLWRMLQASDHERQTISYEIHDGLAQYLAGATMQFQVHDSLKGGSPKKARKAYETAVELVRQSHAESRRLISEVRPPIIDENGVEMAISHLVHEQRRHGGPKIECHSNVQFGRLPPILENAIYRVAQEALTNACKHSKSKNVAVTMTQEGQDVRLEVRDNGIGFDPESVEKGHFGLEGIRQRVRLLGGRLIIESKPGTGTLIQVVVPIVERQNEG